MIDNYDRVLRWAQRKYGAEIGAGFYRRVFADGDDALWRQVLRQLGGEYALLSTFPDDPRLN